MQLVRKYYERYNAALATRPRLRYWVKEWIEPLLIAAILALFIRAYFVQAFKIPTGSMRETLLEGDRILVNKLLYRYEEPKRGDVVVFRYPLDRKRDFIKRLIASGGETVQIANGHIYVNDELITAPPIMRQTYYYNRDDWDYGKTGQVITVPADSYFVMGDNSAHSSDSRFWGFVPKKDMLGKAFFVYWPPQRWKVIK